MKFTTSQLKQIIKEELQALNESEDKIEKGNYIEVSLIEGEGWELEKLDNVEAYEEKRGSWQSTKILAQVIHVSDREYED